jgi:hypothetical protein
MANTYKALQTVTVGAGGAASITFSNIPQTYTDLVIKASARTTRAAVEDGMGLYFNSDTSSYTWRTLFGTGSSVSSVTQAVGYGTTWVSRVDGNNATSNTFANVEIYIPNYIFSNLKPYNVDGVTENNATEAYSNLTAPLFSSTAAITSATLVGGNAPFAQYSTFTLYGVFNADVSTAPNTPNIGTATAGDSAASITFTGVSNAASYTMISSPGGITGTGATSPITVSGLTNGTSYTFTVVANNPFGTSGASSASNSVTPVALAFREIFTGQDRGNTVYYNNAVGGSWTTSGTTMPLGGALGSSSKTKTNSNRMYFWGNDGSPNNKCYSTATGNSWREENNCAASGDWSNGTYVNGQNRLVSVGNYVLGYITNVGVLDSGGVVTWSQGTNYPTYSSAPMAESLSTKALIMGGFTNSSLSSRQTTIWSTTTGASWTSETGLPFTPPGGYGGSASLKGGSDTRVYVCNGTAVWSRGDSSGTWTSETSLPATAGIGSGVYNSSTGVGTLQFAGGTATYFQTLSASGSVPSLGSWTVGPALPVGGDTTAYRGWITL